MNRGAVLIITMNYRSIIFREFTQESLRRIERYREEESAQLLRQTVCEDDNDEQRCLKQPLRDESIATKRVPNKELAVGQTLPRVLQNKFPDELIGKPIEEIDPCYRAEYVRIIP